MRTFRLIALTPPGLIDPSLAVAASRAGELGVLNLAYIQDDVLAQRAIARMVRYGRGAHGIRLASSTAPALLDRISSHLPEQVETVILTAWSSKDLSGLISRLRERQLTVILEATSVDQAQRGEQLEVDGLIAKGSESAGWVGGETTFVLLQRLLSETSLPVWAWGGIGLHTAAACYAAGAAGVVLDSQLALTRESPLPEEAKQVIARMDGTETVCLGSELGARCRVYGRPGLRPLGVLREVIGELRGDDRPSSVVKDLWRQAVAERVGWDSPEECVWLLGQDVALARSLADRFRTVGGVFTGIREAIDDHVSTSRRVKPLDEGSPLARSHGTRYPIVQGPMTRVSDRAEFALRVAEGGGLPFVALGLMRGSEVGDLLAETHKLLGDRPWGVGILGFAPSSLRQEQLGVIQAYQPDFALIAGGRPDQARTLERQGIPTYLHVPSPGLLRMFLQDGARRFVFEGREGGGHVGPRSSFVLWDIMVDVLLEDVSEDDAEACHVLFAGGIHDGLSASMVATLAAPLLERGVRVGVLLGTAYLFTEEAIASAAIQPGFQQQAIQCAQTVLLETSPGHIIRCVETPYVHVFEQEKQRLCEEGKSAEEIHDVLEAMNVGRLRIASKGIDRHPRYGQDPDVPKFVDVSEEKQRQQGMYMVGQIAGLRNCSCTIDELHRAIAFGSSRRLEALSTDLEPVTTSTPARPSEIAIVGMSCILPRARELEAYWDNILNEVNAVVEVPKERWDLGLYFDPDRKARDKIYSRWGAFIDEVPFDPVEYGLAPNSLSSIDPMQLLALKAARMALQDAGYLARAFDRRRTSVILGASGGVGDLGASYVLRSSLPLLFGETTSAVVEDAADTLPEWTEDSFAGILLNVAAGRITNRLDLGGLNYIVDAACASSLAAVHVAVRELEFGNSDMVVTGGVDTVQNPFGYLCFSKTQALSPTGEARVFDATADGIVLGEGVAMLVLKRLADAERDGDRVYAVIQGMGGSSDGRAMGVTAPRPEGQMLALRRAYAKAGIPPSTVGLFEAHGTGTVVGDRTEALALSTFLEEAGSRPRSHAIGSVKSMIGHTKATAGVAGLAKAALALYHGVLPPTLGVTEPNLGAQNGESSLYVNSKTRPWIHGVKDYPRRAGVSAFGFGGSNFHAVLEEYAGDFLPKPAVSQHWPSELLLWSASSRAELIQAVRSVEEALAQGAQPRLRDLAYSLYEARNADREAPGFRLAVVAESLRDLQDKLGRARDALSRPEQVRIADPRGVYFVGSPHQLLAREGEVAFLFPGQGSQSPNMLLDLAVAFPEVRETFERADRVLTGRFPKPLSSYVFPPPAFSPEQEREQRQGLTQTNVAQPALGAAEMALFDLLQNLGVQPDLVAGHSYGEYVALCAAGAFSEEVLVSLSEMRGRCIVEAARHGLGTMAAASAGRAQVAEVVDTMPEVCIANLNAPEQTIISGTEAGVGQAVDRLAAQGIRARSIPVACAFHSPIVAPAQERLAEYLSTVEFVVPHVEVFSNTTAQPYPSDPDGIAALLAEHLVRPVRFADEVRAMYEAGARVFVEVGPRNVLTGLTQKILDGQAHLALAVDAPGRHGLTRLQHALGQLAAHGVPVQLDRLFEGRAPRRLSLDALGTEAKGEQLSPTTWLVTGGEARPASVSRQPAAARRSPVQPPKPPEKPSTVPAEEISSPAPTSESHSAEAHDARRGMSCESEKRSREHQVRSGLPSAPRRDPTAPRHSGETGQVMLQFQQLMSRFLETQKQVMTAYLNEAPGAAAQVDERLTEWEAPAPSPASSQTPLGPELEERADRPAQASTPEVPRASEPAPADLHEAEVSPVERSVEAAEPGLGREQLAQRLLQIVSERTGYPTEMLDLGVDIEADLGIDSIKRVEILGAFQRAHIPADRRVGEEAMDQLTGIKTLRGIVDWIDRALSAGAEEATDEEEIRRPEAAVAEEGSDEAYSQVSRYTWAAVDAPLVDDRAIGLASDRVFLITDDGRGVSRAVADGICDLGGRAVVVQSGEGAGAVERARYQADLTDPAAVGELVATVHQQEGPIGGIVHLLPLQEEAEFAAESLASWRDRLRREVKSLFFLAKAAAEDLKDAGESGGAWLVAATGMGGSNGVGASEEQALFPGQAGIAGLVRTVALEWPTVRCEVVDFASLDDGSLLAERLLHEIASDDGEVAVGYQGTQRRALRLRPSPLDGRSVHLAIDSDWVILVTGGARGITAEAACELAEQYQPTLLLAGRSPLPEPQESPQTAGLTSPHELKSALMDGMRQAGEKVELAQVEAAYKRLMKDRAMRRNLTRMREAGARVRYFQADVRDERGMADLIEEIHREYGRLDGVIHGAGIIEDKLIEDKTPESFDRVFDTKADSVFILSRVLEPESLKFLVLFSSTAGAFGNRGQCDYAAANEVMSKVATHLDRRWPARVVSINWGPWEKRGMVSEELLRQFERRGITLIPSPVGRRRLVDEIRYGRKGESEPIIAGGGWEDADTDQEAAVRTQLPLLQPATLSTAVDGAIEVVRTFDLSRDLYLRDHQLDGKPVLPAAMAMELMAEVVQYGWPDLEVAGLRDLQVLRGVILDNGLRTVSVLAEGQQELTHERPGVNVKVEIADPEAPDHPYYRAAIELADTLPEPPPFQSPFPGELQPFPMPVDEAYRQWLFHGPIFHGIVGIQGMSERGMVATCRPSSPRRSLTGDPDGHWLIDPVVIDSGLQLSILWARAYLEMTTLISRFRRYHRWGSLSSSEVHCYLHVLGRPHERLLSINISFVDPEGRLLGLAEDVEFPCSKGLNRLSGGRIRD